MFCARGARQLSHRIADRSSDRWFPISRILTDRNQSDRWRRHYVDWSLTFLEVRLLIATYIAALGSPSVTLRCLSRRLETPDKQQQRDCGQGQPPNDTEAIHERQ